ncbi:MAG TPA: allophanate hydrolase [Methylocella sp.]|nr:allophanate hydrolase [Methylocella sp.]
MDGASLDLGRLRAAYASGTETPATIISTVLRRLSASNDDGIWISRFPDEVLFDAAAQLCASGNKDSPLYGVPFAVKDNIDVAGLPTTAACEAYRYVPQRSAPVVERLIDAGALLIGKTNLDQFATGLVGTRSPFGTPRNPFDPAMAPGGSSSGSAVAVAIGLVSFSLGTDTAGSGRVPASFNNLVGLKPTRGLISTRGVVPACRSLDCVSIFALTVDDAVAVLDAASGVDQDDPFSRAPPPGFSVRYSAAPNSFRFGIPRHHETHFFANQESAQLFEEAIGRATALGGVAIEVDFTAFTEVASLLYEAWTAERILAPQTLLEEEPEALHPVTRVVFKRGMNVSGADVFRAQHRLKMLAKKIEPIWRDIDFLLVPTTGTAYSLAEIESDPIARNSDLGIYTNFTNLLDLAAIAIPSGFTRQGFPTGVTLIGPAWCDMALAGVARRMQNLAATPLGATAIAQPPLKEVSRVSPATFPNVELAVFGSHLSGEPLNRELAMLGARFSRRCKTTQSYRMILLPGEPARPGLLEVGAGGSAIEGELWSIPSAAVGAFLATIAPPLGLGTVHLEGGESSLGFICAGGTASSGAQDISHYGSWRAFRNAEGPQFEGPRR